MKDLPLLEYTFCGLLRRAMKHLKVTWNYLVSKLGNTSKNKARVRLQVYSNTYAFPSVFAFLQYLRRSRRRRLKGRLPFHPIPWEVSLGRA